MRVPTNLARGNLGFNMTPMIDVVFLLIIFFLVSSHLAQQEVQLDLDLPDAGSGQRPDREEIRRVVVNVLPQEEPAGRIMVGGRLMHEWQLAKLIDYESRDAGRQLEVRIRTDRRVPYRMIEPLMVACARAGVWKVTFAVAGR
ncbi:MAG: biopolymer transporter ExbD [Pirellulales bacterium]|nr:biopolymer transporter ExbD [Pirellulales bacterium]